MNMWMMYLVLKLDDITQTLQVLSVIAILFLGIGLIITVVLGCIAKSDDDTDLLKAITKPKNVIIKFLSISFLLLLIGVVLPNTKQAAAIYFVPKVINNKQMQKMPNKLVNLANAWMEDELKTIKSKS